MKLKHKNTFFSSQKTIKCGGKLLTFEKPLVMGILNITPDSFYDGGKHSDMNKILSHVGKMLSEEADIIDVGAISTKPGASEVSFEDERDRLIPVLENIVKEFPTAIISVDTYRSKIARIAVDKGAHIINDISAGNFDAEMFNVISDLNVPYMIMHMQGTPSTMQKNPAYTDVFKEVGAYFIEKVTSLRNLGVTDIIIDPGFGFGKSVDHNYELLNNLEYFSIFGLPLMIGVSRKSMINKVLQTCPDQALNGTTVLNTIALMKGANILRVHDVKEAVETVKLVGKFRNELLS